ncbi:MAG TPA: nicotinamide-nucleotide amidohydrolase family protein, partial [Acidimicrobiia bacterium]|nr:nicotinamide-nucleotide amidohydrolase family protein [Acidimicrobiia bacterium]
GIYIKLSVSSSSIEMAKDMIVPIEEKVKNKVGEYVYAFDEETMESQVIDLLRESNSTLGVCESLTGGMVMSRLIDIPGASDVISGGMVTYKEEIKRDVLGVHAQDVYSHDCAQQMAENLRKKLNTTYVLSTTGVAGPNAENDHNAGEVYIGISSEKDLFSEEFLLGGDRQRVREYCTITALNTLRKHLLNQQK